MRRLIWCLKQLLPLRYESRFSDGDGICYHRTWRMWFGKVFCLRDV